MAAREGTARWSGDLTTGSGELVVGEDAWNSSYAAGPRFNGVMPGFEGGIRTNPEELLATAHAACFSMSLALFLSQGGHTPRSIETKARVHLRNLDGVPTIQQIELDTEVDVPGLNQDALSELATQAEGTCILSRALAGVEHINVSARSVPTSV